MSSFLLKIIAVISMIFDHTGYIIFGGISWFNYIGRFSFPIFAFGISEGYKYTKNLKKYFLKLFIFAILSQIPFMLFRSIISENFLYLNIFFTLILGLLSITIYERLNNKILGFVCLVLLGIFSEFLKMDYGIWGVFIIFIFHLFKDKPIQMSIFYMLSCIAKFIPELLKYNFSAILSILLCFTILPIIFINLYNGKQGRKIKYFLYLFYPVHLLLLYFAYLLLN